MLQSSPEACLSIRGVPARMGLARRSQGVRRRRCGDIVDDEQRRDRRATPMRAGLRTQIPSGSGFTRASASLPLLNDGTASPASRRLASVRAKPGTRPLLILGQAPRGSSGKPFFANIGIENKGLLVREIEKKRVSGWISSGTDFVLLA